MKQLLLKHKFALTVMLMLSTFTQFIFAQNSSDNAQNFEMQSFTIEFNSLNGPAASRTLELSFSESTSDDFDDGYDTKNLQLLPDDLNLLLNGEFYTTQAYSEINEEKIVDLVFQASGSYNYSIQLTALENMGAQNLELRDNLNEVTFDLRSGEAFEFSSESGYFPGRFQITFKTTTLSQNEFDIENLDVRYINDTNSITISNPNNIDIKQVEVFNIAGQKVYDNNTVSNESSINFKLNNLFTGAYIIKLVTNDNSILTQKIMAIR